MQPQDRFCVFEHHIAVGRKSHPATLVMKQGLAGNVLKPLNLQAYRWLRASQAACCFGNTAGIRDRDQRAKRSDIETDKIHASLLSEAKLQEYPVQVSCKRKA